ncbi:MAG: hypothetical protein E6G94_06200 [Alphaproteobacteria bacterium]|nr:MAG: hypothetical protein E6G94_06200 [Alphaproteobacteria bacterium]
MSDSASHDPFDFEPVPSRTNRRDGWTPERQRIFIAAFRKIGVVSYAAEAAGMSRKSAYKLLERAGPDSGFARAWEEAQAGGGTNVMFAMIERAVEGVEEPYFYGGLQRGTRRVYDNRLLVAAYRSLQRLQGGE